MENTDFTKTLINPPKLLAVNEVAKRLGKDPQTVRRYIEAGLYPFAEAQKLYGRTKYAIFSREFEEYCGPLDAEVKKITVTDIAKQLGKDPQIVRKFIEAGLYPFAVAHKRPGSNRWNYTIFPAKFEEYCGTEENKKITITDAAKHMKKSSESVRKFIKAGLYPFAIAHKLEGRSQWDYTIFPAKFEEYYGPLDAEIKKITPTDVAKRFGIKESQFIRINIICGLYPFAVAHKCSGNFNWNYTIFPVKFEEYCAKGGKPELWKLEKLKGKVIYSAYYKGPRPNEAIFE